MKIYDIPQDEYISLVYNELIDIIGDCRDDVEYEKIDGLLTLAMKTIYHIGGNNAVKRMKELADKER